MDVDFSALHICTLTCIGSVYHPADRAKKIIDLEKVEEQLEIDDEIKGVKGTNGSKGEPVSLKIKKLKEKGQEDNTKVFGNSMFILIKIGMDEDGNERRISCKLFSNGRVHIPGCKNKAENLKVLEILVDKLRGIDSIAFIKPMRLLTPYFESIKLINSNLNIFDASVKETLIDNNELFMILTEEYGIKCVFEKTIHLALNFVLMCEKPEKKGLTISVFQTGNIIITGATTFEHLDQAYDKVTGILRKHYSRIKMSVF